MNVTFCMLFLYFRRFIPATSIKFYEALGLSSSKAADRRKCFMIKGELRVLAGMYLDSAYTFRKQPDCCLALFWLHVSRLKLVDAK
jgi:hypothetical protein